MTETIEQLCQRVMDARRYLVMALDRPAEIGEVFRGIAGPDLNHPIVVISETTLEDLVEQNNMMHLFTVQKPGYDYFYRVVAE